MQVFHPNWVFDAMLPLEGEQTDYRFAVIRGQKGKIGEEVGLRRTYTLLKKSPDEDQPVGAEAEPEKEPEDVVEQPIKEEAPTEAPEEVPAEEVPEETPEVPPSEEAPLAEEVPAEEEPPVEEVVVEEVPAEEAASEQEPEPEPEPEAAPEPEVVEEVAEEVAEPEPEEDIEEPLKIVFEPETPVYVDVQQSVKGIIHGFEKSETLYVTIEKSASDENGWMGWAERDVRFRGERIPALTYTDC
jgi:hypothetical protein